MGDGTAENPLNSADVYMRIAENDSRAEGLDLSGNYFEQGINLAELDLTGAILNGVILNGAILKEAGLDKCHLKGVRLIEAHLEGAYLEEANLTNANLSRAHLEDAQLISTNLERARLSGAHLERANFFGANLIDANLSNAFLDKTSFAAAYLQGAQLSHAKFTDDTDFSSTHWGDYKLGEEKRGDNKDKKYLLHWAAHVYRRLKIWYSRAGRYDIAGKFFYREQESYRKLIQSTKQKRINQFWMLVWLWVFRLTCGYGEKPQRVAISAAIVIFGSALSYWGGGMDVLYSLYFSAVSFTALGYGSWVYPPSALWMQTVGAIESFFGISIMALFLVTFVRKMSR